MLKKKLFSPSCGVTKLLLTIGSAQLNLILSTVAGECNSNTSSSPHCFLAAFNASLMAKNTADPMNSGGSPTPLDL